MMRVLLLMGLLLFSTGHAEAPASPWDANIAAFEAADHRQPPPRDAIFFIGSSSIRLWTSLANDFPALAVVNRGFGGSEIRDSTRYLPRIVLPHKPSAIVLYAGDNDLSAGRSVDQVVADLQAFVAAVRTGSTAPVFFLSIKPSPARAALLPKLEAANARIATWMKTQPQLHYVDIATPMLDSNGQPRAELFGPDRLHMNAEGYALWKRVLAPQLASVPRGR